jgi:hypothetical protein
MRGHTITIHVKGSDKVYPKQLIPFWNGKIPLSSALAALDSHLYCFGGMNYSHDPLREGYKLRVNPHMGKEWVRVSPPMISKRCNTAASVLGGNIYVRNRLPFHHTADCWSEVFDPVNRKWEALPNPPSYVHDCLII